jgi:phosphonate transport system substrate-binding protein
MNVELLSLAWQNGADMKNLKLFVLFFIGIFLGACSAQKDENLVRLGVQPNEKTANLDAFTQELSAATGLNVKIVTSTSYEDLVTQFKANKIDFAFFSPVNFISAEKSAGAKVLLKKVYGNSEFYYSAIVVREGSSVKTVSDLKGKKVAFVDKRSTSGYLYPLVLFRNASLSLKDFSHEFYGTHDDAVKAVVEGRAEAAAVWGDEPHTGEGAWSQWAQKNKVAASFRVVAWSEPIPNDAFAVRSDFYLKHPNIVFRVMEGMISLSDSSQGSLKDVFDTDKMTTATSRHYDSVRAILEAQKEIDQ